MRTVGRFTLWLLLAGLGSALADEGMWTFDHFPTAKMQAAYGWAPDAAWLKHAQLASIRLAEGCSASLVSPDGLVMTNHHCARECVGELSDNKHDYIGHGFYAATLNDEKKCAQLEANQLIEITDVTAQVDAATAGKSDAAFHDAERSAKASIEHACGTAADVRCEVVTLYQGGVYDLYKYKRYQDLRLVFVPEASMAFFGGDPDNFTFPRYDLDCAFVRIYDNGKPLHTDDYLKFSTQGVKDGDIALTSGNPGSTQRGDTLAQLEFLRDYGQPFVLNFFSEARGVLNQFGSEGPDQKQSADTLTFSIENSLKAYKGMQMALTQGTLMADAARAEQKFRAHVAADPKLASAAGGAWNAIAKAMEHRRAVFIRLALLERYPGLFSPLLLEARALNRYAAEVGKPDGDRLEEYSDANFPALKQEVESNAPIHKPMEKVLLAWWLTKVREYLGSDDADVKAIMGPRSPEEIAAALVDGTKLADPKLRAQLLAGGAAAINAYHDPLMDFERALDPAARAVRKDAEDNVNAVVTQNQSLLAKARFAIEGTNTYPDATFTLRLSYGAVAGYDENGHHIDPVTHIRGAFAHATGRDPFKLPDSWIKAQSSLDQDTNLNFATNDDIIGGNSGSPVIGRDGQVIGLIFDGDIQSLGGDFGFDPSVNRAVAVDVTGITEALRHVYHADRLVQELTP